MRTVPLAAALLVTLAGGGAARAEHTWGLGLKATTQHIAPPEGEPGNEVQLAGAGLQARWRFAPRFGVELSLEGLGGAAGETFERTASAASVTGTFHLFPGGRWNVYLLLGVGAREDEVRRGEVVRTYEQRFFSAGAGLEYLWTHLGVGVELRGLGYARKDADQATPWDEVPAKSGGVQASLTATYYF